MSMGEHDEMTVDSDRGPSFEDEVAESLAAAASMPVPADISGRKPIESWAVELRIEDWLFAAAKMHARWPTGREVTRAEFEEAIKGVDSVTCR